MEEKLLFSDLIKKENLFAPQKFPDEIFSLLGAPLTKWVMSLLDELSVTEDPIIEGDIHPTSTVEGRVFIHAKAKVEPNCYIKGPTYIGPETEVRHGAYIRGSVFVGKKCVVGHTSEVKGSVFLDGAKAGHFAYVGDSILGPDVNLGAGTKLANLKLKKDLVRFIHPKTQNKISSPLKKFGSVLGDSCQTGCNAVLSPGTLLMPHTLVMPCTHYSGTLMKGIAR